MSLGQKCKLQVLFYIYNSTVAKKALSKAVSQLIQVVAGGGFLWSIVVVAAVTYVSLRQPSVGLNLVPTVLQRGID